VKILDVVDTPDLLRAHAEIDSRRFEFAAHMGGPFEVYDYPPDRKGVPRFVGHLPEQAGALLLEGLRRRGVVRFSGGYLFHGLPRWRRTPLGPYTTGDDRPDGRGWQRTWRPT
jgi:hypothetical protein